MESIEEFRVTGSVVYEMLSDILVSKQLDYGPGNINNAPGGAMNGILVRMNDKMERLKNLIYHSEGEPQNESIDDSLVDIANYAVIAMMVRNGSWPKNLE
jgi:DNA polymerase II small subunit/DNA polymerase delta subunit B